MVAGLVAAHVAIHAAAFNILLLDVQFFYPRNLFEWLLIAVCVLGPGEGMLLAMWVVLGGGKFVWRASLALLAVVYLSYFSKLTEEWLIYSLGEAGVWLVLFLAARCTGLQLSQRPDMEGNYRRFQFSIRDMFVWTTTVAVFLSAWYTSAWYTTPGDAHSALYRSDIGMILLIFTAVAAVSMFSTLTRGWLAVRVVLLPIVVAAAAGLISRCFPTGDPFWYHAVILGIMAAWLVVSCLVLRFAGYRLAWRPRLAEPQEDIAA
jgi:hypothetical protein